MKNDRFEIERIKPKKEENNDIVIRRCVLKSSMWIIKDVVVIFVVC